MTSSYRVWSKGEPKRLEEAEGKRRGGEVSSQECFCYSISGWYRAKENSGNGCVHVVLDRKILEPSRLPSVGDRVRQTVRVEARDVLREKNMA